MISVGIDISKGKSMVCILKPGGEVLAAPFDMLHNIESINALVSLINSYDEETRVVLEDTGHYHWPVVTMLLEHNIFVSCINALRMKKFCSQSIRKGKTDKIDAIKIAQFGITYWNELKPYMPADEVYENLRLLSRQYYQYVSLLTKSKVNFSNILDRVMPDISSLLDAQNGKLYDVVERYCHFSNITKMGERRFISDYCKWAKKKGYHSNESKSAQIYSLAVNGIPSLPYNQASICVVKEAIKSIRELSRSRDTILSQMKELANTLPEYSILISMHGIGDVLSTRFIADIGDVRRFHSKNAVVAYAGIDAPPYQSGSFTASTRHISKRGNKYLRRTGFEIMQSFMKQKPTEDCAVYEYMLKKKAEGHPSKYYSVAGLNKFLKIYYARVTELYKTIDDQLIFGSNI